MPPLSRASLPHTCVWVISHPAGIHLSPRAALSAMSPAREGVGTRAVVAVSPRAVSCSSCTWEAMMRGKRGDACSSSCSPSFVLSFFCGLIPLYLIGGVAYQKTQRQASGIELLPNLSFWKDLPSLVKDGCVFTYNNTIRRLVSGNASSTYQSM